MKIQVLRHDIDGGTPMDVCNCAIARSVLRLHGVEDARVDAVSVRIKRRGPRWLDCWREFQLPGEAQLLADRFDHADTPEKRAAIPEMEFELERLGPWLEHGA
jgi:hypothetical protein